MIFRLRFSQNSYEINILSHFDYGILRNRYVRPNSAQNDYGCTQNGYKCPLRRKTMIGFGFGGLRYVGFPHALELEQRPHIPRKPTRHLLSRRDEFHLQRSHFLHRRGRPPQDARQQRRIRAEAPRIRRNRNSNLITHGPKHRAADGAPASAGFQTAHSLQNLTFQPIPHLPSFRIEHQFPRHLGTLRISTRPHLIYRRRRLDLAIQIRHLPDHFPSPRLHMQIPRADPRPGPIPDPYEAMVLPAPDRTGYSRFIAT